jgi:glycosyltransferase involved in cell wall biosynthesis
MSSEAQRARVLWVGRMLFNENIRVRETELAQRVAERADLFALDRSDALPRTPQGLAGKLRMRLKLRACRFAELERGPVTRFRMPVTGFTGPVFNRVAARCNAKRLARVVRHYACSHVFMASPFFFIAPPPGRRDYRVHFDIIDNFHDEWPDTLVGRSRRAFFRDALLNSDTISACSHGMCDLVKRITGRDAVYIPNGAPVERYRSFDQSKAVALREQLGVADKFVVGFIGNHDMPFDGMQRLLDAWVLAHEQRPELALLIVGPGADKLAKPRGLGPAQGVHAIGPVPPDEVAAYFHACDAGVHPYDMQPSTHDANPLNIIEFAICRKPMLVNPLRELRRMMLPHMRYTPDDSVDAWAAALADPTSFAGFDDAALQASLEPFDWDKAAAALCREMGL